MDKEIADLKYFLAPRSIAIVGASNNFSSISGKSLRFLDEQGYDGKIYPINPKYDELKGYKCYKSITEVPEPVDLALVAVNYKLVLPMLEQCAEKGVKNATIYASGFAESGEEGRELQRKIAELAKTSGMRVCGPNCQGSVGLREKAIGGFSASLGVKPLLTGPIGYVTQSGALGYSIFSLAQEAGVGFSYVASTGNEVDLHTLDFMEFMIEDESTKMVIAYLEGIKNGKQFRRLAERALELGKPIVALKVGRSEVGQKAAASHTASLTGSDSVADAFFRQKGIIRADDIEDMIDLAALMQRIPKLPEGKNIGIITTSGGGGILAADAASDLDLNIPELGDEVTAYIEKYIPAYGSALNPVDITAQVINEADDYPKVLQAMVDHPDMDALALVITQITGDSGRQMAEDTVKVAKASPKPIVLAWTTGDKLVGDFLGILKDGGVQFGKSPVRAVKSMGRLMNYGAFRKEYMARKDGDAAATDKATLDKAMEILGTADGTLTEHQGKELFALYDIPVTKEGIATSEDEAVVLGEDIGYPVVLKIDSPDIMHKTEAGGLKLDIKDTAALKVAYKEVIDSCKKYKPDAKINGVSVQEMVPPGTEVIVGVNNDPLFGPTIMFGLGGIFVEILKDVALRVAPITKSVAMNMIKQIKGYKVLAGARGKEKMDVEAIADVLVKVSRLATDLEDHVAELDVNPLIVLPEGKGARVADALVIKK